MRKISFLLAVLLLYVLPSVAKAQFIGGSYFDASDSLVYTQSGTGTSGAAFPFNPSLGASVQNLGGVVQVLLGSTSACQTITPNAGWTLIPNSLAGATGLCQALYFKIFDAADKTKNPEYTFSWTGSLPYDVRMYVISNVSAIDVASNASNSSDTPTAASVVTTVAGDYLMGFFAQLGTGTWISLSDAGTNMGVAVENDDPDSGPNGEVGRAKFPNLTTQGWAYPIGSTGTETAATSDTAQWVADLVAFKPLYPIIIPGIAQPLSTFGACGPSTEGEMQTQSNSTAVCSLGAMATSGGTTHCAVRCNGTNWIQTGL
jgi:hypothetical protein